MIYLMRHGEISVPGEKLLVGQIDLPLSEQGLRQAHIRSDELLSVEFERIFSSDLLRTRQTAEIIARGRKQPVQTVAELREIDLGEWDGISRDELETRFPDEWGKRGADLEGYKPPHGESFSDLQARAMPAFLHIVKQTRSNTLIVAHAGVNRVILCHVLGMPLANLFRLGQSFACLNLMHWNGNSLQLQGMNLPLQKE
jgi:alpha-ribazole phosphatase